MLLAAMEFEEIDIAYDLYFLIQEGILSPDAEYRELGSIWNKVDRKITNEWRKNNLLGFDLIHLYACRINASDWMIIMSRTEEEARGYALNKLGAIPKLIHMPKEKFLTSFWFEETKEYKSLMDIKQETASFPTHIII